MVQPPRTSPAADGAPRVGERIAKLLARAGVASRREVERMIAEGRVRIGDELVTTPATVLPNLRGVTVDGQPVKAPDPARLFAFHKPSELITAERDPAGQPTIYTALRNALPPGTPGTPRVMPVGRLDFNTEGLLMMTNDGELKRAMELPSSGIPRTYRARTFGDITQSQLEDLIEGITIEGIHYGKIDANMERSTGRNQWIELTLTEGKNREVRRVLEHLGLEVSRLLRTSYGPFQLLDLPRGAAVEIRQVDVERFRKGLKTPGSPDIQRPAPEQARARIQRTRPDRRADERAPVARGPVERAPVARTPMASAPAGRPESKGKPYAGKPASARADAPRNDGSRTENARRNARRRDGELVDRPARSGPPRSAPARSGPPRSGAPGKGPRRPGPRK